MLVIYIFELQDKMVSGTIEGKQRARVSQPLMYHEVVDMATPATRDGPLVPISLPSPTYFFHHSYNVLEVDLPICMIWWPPYLTLTPSTPNSYPQSPCLWKSWVFEKLLPWLGCVPEFRADMSFMCLLIQV